MLGLLTVLLAAGAASARLGAVEISGTVTSVEGEPLAGARVSVLPEDAAGDPDAELAGGVYNRGVEAYRARDFDTAIGYFEEALELDPALADAAVAAAAIHYEVGRHAEAVRLAEEVLADDPENARAARVRFLALEAQSPPTERDPEADAALALYAELDPDTVVELLSEWAEEAFEADQRDAAQKHLERLLELRPGLPEAHYRLGLVHAGRGEAEQAKEHLGRFLELAPEHPEAPAAREILEAL